MQRPPKVNPEIKESRIFIFVAHTEFLAESVEDLYITPQKLAAEYFIMHSVETCSTRTKFIQKLAPKLAAKLVLKPMPNRDQKLGLKPGAKRETKLGSKGVPQSPLK